MELCEELRTRDPDRFSETNGRSGGSSDHYGLSMAPLLTAIISYEKFDYFTTYEVCGGSAVPAEFFAWVREWLSIKVEDVDNRFGLIEKG